MYTRRERVYGHIVAHRRNFSLGTFLAPNYSRLCYNRVVVPCMNAHRQLDHQGTYMMAGHATAAVRSSNSSAHPVPIEFPFFQRGTTCCQECPFNFLVGVELRRQRTGTSSAEKDAHLFSTLTYLLQSLRPHLWVNTVRRVLGTCMSIKINRFPGPGDDVYP